VTPHLAMLGLGTPSQEQGERGAAGAIEASCCATDGAWLTRVLAVDVHTSFWQLRKPAVSRQGCVDLEIERVEENNQAFDFIQHDSACLLPGFAWFVFKIYRCDVKGVYS
jgi:hypothetical protein